MVKNALAAGDPPRIPLMDRNALGTNTAAAEYVLTVRQTVAASAVVFDAVRRGST